MIRAERIVEGGRTCRYPLATLTVDPAASLSWPPGPGPSERSVRWECHTVVMADGAVVEIVTTKRSWRTLAVELLLVVAGVLLLRFVAGVSWLVAIGGVVGISAGVALGTWVRGSRTVGDPPARDRPGPGV